MPAARRDRGAHPRRQPDQEERRGPVRDHHVLEQVEEDEVLDRDRPERRVERHDDESHARAEAPRTPRRAGRPPPAADVRHHGDDRQHDEERLEAERPGRRHPGSGRLRRHRRRRPCAARRENEEHERGAERRRLLDHHHHPGELLVSEGREPEQARRLVGVHVVVGVEREDEDVRQQLAGPEQERREPDPTAGAEPPVTRRVDQDRPDQRARRRGTRGARTGGGADDGAPRRRGTAGATRRAPRATG